MTYDLVATVERLFATEQPIRINELVAQLIDDVPDADLREVLGQVAGAYLLRYQVERRRKNVVIHPVPAYKSHKVEVIQRWADDMRDRLHVGHGVHKQLGDCDYNDLIFAANERRELAKANAEIADRLEVLANRLVTAHKTYVRELDPD